MDGIVHGPEGGEGVRRGRHVHRILAEQPDVEVFELAFGPGFAVDPHTHEDETDAFYVLEGEIEVTMGEETIRGGPGTFAAGPPGVRHGFRNAGEGDLRILNVHAPNRGFGEWLRSL
jgi:mannose-6-phosphate isomerase-like protein (cupin superfamily)